MGFPKCGTTALYYSLAEHPDVFLPEVKEPHFFSYGMDKTLATTSLGDRLSEKIVRSREAYEKLFEYAHEGQLRGDFSVSSILHPEAPARIHKHRPDAKLIVIIRHPVDMAFSAYRMEKRAKQETAQTFEEALKLEQTQRTDWMGLTQYRSNATMSPKFKRVLDLFPREQLHVIRYEDFSANPQRVLHGMLDFLNLDKVGSLRVGTANKGGSPRSLWLLRLIRNRSLIHAIVRSCCSRKTRNRIREFLLRVNMKEGEKLPPGLAASLNREFLPDIRETAKLLNLDLTDWETRYRS